MSILVLEDYGLMCVYCYKVYTDPKLAAKHYCKQGIKKIISEGVKE